MFFPGGIICLTAERANKNQSRRYSVTFSSRLLGSLNSKRAYLSLSIYLLNIFSLIQIDLA